MLKNKSENLKIWNDDNAKNIFKKISFLEKKIKDIDVIQKKFGDIKELFALLDKEQDDELLKDIFDDSKKILKDSIGLRYENLLNEEADQNSAFLEFHAGAGGTESQDWAEMLQRMYLRWADSKKYKILILQESKGEEVGIKSSTIKIIGDYAYGWLKRESGIHRLVRISPFDSNKKRDRSQHKNKAHALAMLKSRLYELELQKRKESDNKIHNEKKDIGWGNQIRSYVLHPYKLTKDLRTNYETSNVSDVLDGKIDKFLELSLIK